MKSWNFAQEHMEVAAVGTYGTFTEFQQTPRRESLPNVVLHWCEPLLVVRNTTAQKHSLMAKGFCEIFTFTFRNTPKTVMRDGLTTVSRTGYTGPKLNETNDVTRRRPKPNSTLKLVLYFRM